MIIKITKGNPAMTSYYLHKKSNNIFNLFSNHLVDEIDDGNYYDTKYWKGLPNNFLSVNEISEILKDLEL
jgi:hypothetical protein